MKSRTVPLTSGRNFTCFAYVVSISFLSYHAFLSLRPLCPTGTCLQDALNIRLLSPETTSKTRAEPTSLCKPLPERVLKDLTPLPPSAPASLREYAAWHADARACYLDKKCTTQIPVLVWRCMPNKGCCGFGDRSRGFQFALLLAILMKRLFLLDSPQSVHNPFELQTALRPASIDWRPPRRIAYTSSIHLNWRTRDFSQLPLPFGNMLNLSTGDFITELARFPDVAIAETFRYEAHRAALANPLLGGRFPDLQGEAIAHPDLLRMLTKMLFRYRESVVQQAASIGLNTRMPYIAVHARTGEEVGESENKRFAYLKQGKDLLLHDLMNCTQAVSHGVKQYFLASDSTAFKDRFVKEASRHGMRVFNVRGRAMHLMKSQYAAVDPTEGERCSQFLNVFVDMYLLGHGKVVVGSGSGFSRSAFQLGSATELRVASGREGSEKLCVVHDFYSK